MQLSGNHACYFRADECLNGRDVEQRDDRKVYGHKGPNNDIYGCFESFHL